MDRRARRYLYLDRTAIVKVVVIGAGIAGLSAAMRLRERHDVVVLERGAVTGGKIHSQKIDGFLFDWGPNGFLSNAAELRALADEAGLGASLHEANRTASKRYVYWQGRLHALPAKPPQALGMTLLSPLGKLRALRELFVPARREAGDESVYDFFSRRFGSEVAERLASPALLGITGGDAKATSAPALFPRLPELEAQHGSVIKGMVRSKRPPGRLTSFGAAGMQTLTDAFAQHLGERVRLGTAVGHVERTADGWRVACANEAVDADAVLVAAPSFDAAALLAGVDAELAALLHRIAYAPMRVVGIAFRAQDVPVALDGFGFLAARNQGVRILGALYTSTMYPQQAPEGCAYLRVFLGGVGDPGALELDAAAALAIVRADLARTLRITAGPVAHHEVLWPQAIPQYALGHRALLAAIDGRVKAHPGLELIGNAYHGPGLGDTVRGALAAAARLGD